MATATAAAALGIPTGSLRNIESVKGRPVSLRVIHRAARLYARSADWLQGKDEPKEEPKEPVRRDPTPSEPTAPPARPDRDRKGPPRSDFAEAS